VTLSAQNFYWTGVDLGGGRKFARLDGNLEQTFELNGSSVGCTSVENTYSSFDAAGNFGNYANPSQVIAKTASTCSFVNAFVRTTTNTYTHDTTNWILGQLTRVSTRHEAPGETTITRASSFTYDAGKVMSETIEPDQPASSVLRLATS
jgi:hypothetical protein